MKKLIVFVTLAALAAVIGAIVVGNRSFEGIVTDRPYETGIAWDKTRHDKIESGWNIAITNQDFQVGDTELLLRVTDRKGGPLTAATVAVVISRPHTNAYDRTYGTRETSPGLFSTSVNFPAYGYWDIKMAVSDRGKSVSFDKRIFVQKKGEKQ
ncbi:MAG: FixH family protein [Thermodesulfovibrionales bacterium]